MAVVMLGEVALWSHGASKQSDTSICIMKINVRNMSRIYQQPVLILKSEFALFSSGLLALKEQDRRE